MSASSLWGLFWFGALGWLADTRSLKTRGNMLDKLNLIDRKNELKARLYRLRQIQREYELDAQSVNLEIAVTNNHLRSVEIELERVRN